MGTVSGYDGQRFWDWHGFERGKVLGKAQFWERHSFGKGILQYKTAAIKVK